MVYLWQVRILRLAWLQHAAAWAGIPVLYSSEEPAYTLVPQVRQSSPARRSPSNLKTWLKMVIVLHTFSLLPMSALFLRF